MIARCEVGADNDDCWLAGIQARNRDALEQVFRTYSGQVVRFLSLVEPRQSPEAACLDVFEDLWHGAATIPPHGALADWLFCRAYRALRDRASPAERRSSGQRIALVEALTFEQRVIVALVYGVRLPLDSISKITAMTATEVTWHLSEARERLRHVLA
jgi:DNA-directed RNA polymerase specialized sigma24 family protein